MKRSLRPLLITAALLAAGGLSGFVSITTRTASLETALASTPAAVNTTAETPSGPTGAVRGKINNQSGAPFPAGTLVWLQGFDQSQPVFEKSGPLLAGDAFQFTDVPFPAGRVYVAYLEMNGILYPSEMTEVLERESGLDLPITVYASSTDASVLSADRMHAIFDFSKPDILRVVMMYVISNPTDKLIRPAGKGQAVLQFTLPAGAENLQFRDGTLGERFLQAAAGFGDTYPVFPGEGTLEEVFVFELPYKNGATFSLTAPLPVKSANVMLPLAGVSLASPQLADGGLREIQEGTTVQVYTASDLKAGSKLEITLSGAPNSSGSLAPTPAAAVSSSSGAAKDILPAAAVLLLVLAGCGVWVYRGTRAPVARPAGDADQLLDAIVALDEKYENGGLPEPEYRARREELKELLRRKL